MSLKRKEGHRFWAITITKADPGLWPTGEYKYFSSLHELQKAHPDAILFDGGGHLYSIVNAIKADRVFDGPLISSSPKRLFSPCHQRLL